MREQGSLGDLAQIEANGIVDEVRIESLKNIEIAFKILFRLFNVAGHCVWISSGTSTLSSLADSFGDQGVDLPNVKRLQRIAH